MHSVSGKPGVATITKQEHTAQGNTLVSEPIEEVVADPTPCVVPCSVGVNARQTVNLGNYSNVQIGVHLSVTVEPGDIEEAFEQVSTWVGDKLSELIEQAVGGDSGEAGTNS
jgi:hypothetical protein